MKKLLTILSFILLLLICLVVMFCSNEKVTGGGGDTGGNGDWDTPPNTIIQSGSWTYKVDGYRYTMTVEINAEDRTVSFISNNILLAKEKYDDVFNPNYEYDYYFEKGEGRMWISGYGLLSIIPSNTNYIIIQDGYSDIKYNIVSGELKPAMNIGADYNYNFALDMHYNFKKEEYSSGFGKVIKTYNYTNLQLKLGKDNSIYIELNPNPSPHKHLLNIEDINNEKNKDYFGNTLEKLDWDRGNKILTIITTREYSKNSSNSFIFDFINKTATIKDLNNREVKGYLIDKSKKHNVKKPSGWYFTSRYSIYNTVYNVYALYFDCNPTNQLVYGYEVNTNTKTLNFIFKGYRDIYTSGNKIFTITNNVYSNHDGTIHSGIIVGNTKYYLSLKEYKGYNFSDSIKPEEKPPHEEDLKYTELNFWGR